MKRPKNIVGIAISAILVPAENIIPQKFIIGLLDRVFLENLRKTMLFTAEGNNPRLI
jgi:hypothetical protein